MDLRRDNKDQQITKARAAIRLRHSAIKGLKEESNGAFLEQLNHILHPLNQTPESTQEPRPRRIWKRRLKPIQLSHEYNDRSGDVYEMDPLLSSDVDSTNSSQDSTTHYFGHENMLDFRAPLPERRWKRLIKPRKLEDEYSDHDSDISEMVTPLSSDDSSNSSEDITEIEDTDTTSTPTKIDKTSNLLTEYLPFILDTNSDGDHVTGITGSLGNYQLGKTEVKFDQTSNTIRVGGEVYPVTRGLFELLFKNSPDPGQISSQDKINYRDIMELTSAHRRYSQPSQCVKKDMPGKIREYVFRKPRAVEAGFRAMKLPDSMMMRTASVDNMHWDDPNALVDRLR